VKLVVAVAIAVALLAAGFWVERRATSCGAGLVDTHLPYDLRADWFNGGFWLTDAEGWGVVAPPGDLELSSGAVLEVERIERYTRERGFVVEVTLASGDHALISFEGSTRATPRPRLVESSQLDGVYALREHSPWTAVDPGSCFYGRFGVVRALVATGLVGLVVVAWRARWKPGRERAKE